MGQSELRSVFLKTDNPQGGRYLAEITRELLDDQEEFKYGATEWRLSKESILNFLDII
jgi:AMP deaminase